MLDLGQVKELAVLVASLVVPPANAPVCYDVHSPQEIRICLANIYGGAPVPGEPAETTYINETGVYKIEQDLDGDGRMDRWWTPDGGWR